jgi:hypothetical protein
MTNDLLLKNGLIITSSGAIRGGLAIAGERIAGVGIEDTLGSARREIDLQGKIVMPGLFDPHVHLGLSGDTFGDDAMATDFEFDTRECLIGGVTTIATTTLIGREPLPELFLRAIKCGESRSGATSGHLRGQRSTRSSRFPRWQRGRVPASFTGYAGAQAEGFGMSKGHQPGLLLRPAAPSTPPDVVFPMIHAEIRSCAGLRSTSSGRGARSSRGRSSPEWAESVQIYIRTHRQSKLGCPLYPVYRCAGVDTIASLKAQGLPIVGETIRLLSLDHRARMDAINAAGENQPPRFPERSRSSGPGIRRHALGYRNRQPHLHRELQGARRFQDCRVGVSNQVADSSR